MKTIFASAIVKKHCEKVNLRCMNQLDINIADYENKENEGILVVRHAGETLYRLSKKSAG